MPERSFRTVYEDWSPINARQNSWDSPLAGHASSIDGFTGFEHHEHLPPVDHRTEPTGQTPIYTHPETACSYEEHIRAQDAFGDWTTIKVGQQYFLFGDYDVHDAGIRLARFSSDSLYEELDLVGSLGNGHPDPTVGLPRAVLSDHSAIHGLHQPRSMGGRLNHRSYLGR